MLGHCELNNFHIYTLICIYGTMEWYLCIFCMISYTTVYICSLDGKNIGPEGAIAIVESLYNSCRLER
jgi:hypothetical protein